MDFRDLEAYVHVARHENFSRAAACLGIAQSALSRRVDRLEYQLGATLVARHARGVRLTEAGLVLLGRAEALIRELEAVEADVQCLAKDPTGHVRVALPPATSEVLSPLLVLACREKYPRISLHIREGFSDAIHRWLMNGEVDVAVLYSPDANAELEIVPLLDEPLHLVMPASMAAPNQKRFNAKDLKGISLVMPARPHSLRLVVERYAAEHGFSPKIACEVDGIRTIKAMIEAGFGCTIFTHAEMVTQIAAGTLRALPLHPALHWRLSTVVRRSAPPSRATSEVRNLIQKQVLILLQRRFWRGKLLVASKPAPAA